MPNNKDVLKESAFAMFTVESYTNADIARRLNVADKTVRIWRKSFEEYIEKGQVLHTRLYMLNQLRFESAIADIMTTAKLEERVLSTDEIASIERIKKLKKQY